MKTFEVTYNRKKNKGVFAISLVENPAMEAEFIALAKKERAVQLKTIDAEKRELIGLVLEPNKPIYRNQNNEEYNIVFSEDVIKELLIGFSENGNQTNSTIEHEERLKLEGVTFFENWIVEDEDNDKSNAYGLNAKKGSWITKLKIDDESVWDDFVKTGVVKGFSIDAMVDLQEINLNSNMNKVELNESDKSWFKELLSPLFKSKDEAPVALESDEKKEEEEVKQEEAPMLTDEMKTEIMEMIRSVISEMTTEMEKKEDEKEVAMKAEIKSLKEENLAMKAEIKKIGEQPASQPIKSQPVSLSDKANESMVEFLNRVTK